jgi:hypothetical protein
MVWLGDSRNTLSAEQKVKLLQDRSDLIRQIELLKKQPVSKTQTGINGRQEDLIALAKKVTAIDKKLGRLV